ALSVLRKLLPDGALLADAQSIALDLDRVDVDAVTFDKLARSESIDDLQRAVSLYDGDLLDGFHARAPAFDEWLLFERQRLRERAVSAMRHLLDRLTEAREHEAAIRVAVRLLALDS